MRKTTAIYPIVLLLAFCLPARAQQVSYQQLSAGTGFIINRSGDIVTNAHVLNGCQSISVLSEGGEVAAALMARDTTRDLAVIRTALTGNQMVAPLRWDIRDLKVGDPVVVMGFPGREGAMGQSRYRNSRITALNGPQGEANWIQLTSVAEHGNSGGPVLDSAGNVIAVITGIAMTYRTDAQGNIRNDQLVGQSDVAIPLADLQQFLQRNGIGYYEAATGNGSYGDGTLARTAHKFIVPVHCLKGPVTR